MHQPLWAEGPAPSIGPQIAPARDWSLSTPGEVTLSRMQLRRETPPCDTRPEANDDVDRLLLTFEELASNGLRHGRAPVCVSVITAADGWLIDVTDAATDRPPAPATDRDPAYGGLGLHLVARLSVSHGWSVEATCKHVWAYVLRTPQQATTQPA